MEKNIYIYKDKTYMTVLKIIRMQTFPMSAKYV